MPSISRKTLHKRARHILKTYLPPNSYVPLPVVGKDPGGIYKSGGWQHRTPANWTMTENWRHPKTTGFGLMAYSPDVMTIDADTERATKRLLKFVEKRGGVMMAVRTRNGVHIYLSNPEERHMTGDFSLDGRVAGGQWRGRGSHTVAPGCEHYELKKKKKRKVWVPTGATYDLIEALSMGPDAPCTLEDLIDKFPSLLESQEKYLGAGPKGDFTENRDRIIALVEHLGAVQYKWGFKDKSDWVGQCPAGLGAFDTALPGFLRHGICTRRTDIEKPKRNRARLRISGNPEFGYVTCTKCRSDVKYAVRSIILELIGLEDGTNALRSVEEHIKVRRP